MGMSNHRRAGALLCAAAVFVMAGCGGSGSGQPPAFVEPSAKPTLSPPLSGTTPPLLPRDGPSTGGRLPAKSPYTLFTLDGDGRQGDPINLAFVATRTDLTQALTKAGWLVADPLNAVSKAKMVRAFLLRQPYPNAPVSDLFLFGRSQDIAFEKNSENTNKRDHFRVWQTQDMGTLNRPIWVAAATKDVDVAINPNTGGPTHRIASNVDAERELVRDDLIGTGRVEEHYLMAGVGKPWSGHNGADDYIFSDGMIAVIAIKP